jgi:DNA-binding Lrp family transcriptional regulator
VSESRKIDGFKLPGSSLDEIFKIVQGYANHGRSASLTDISKRTGMHTTAVSKNVGFLLGLGIIEGGKNKSATEIGSMLGHALMHGVQDEVQNHLNTIVEGNEFLKSILAAVRIRKGMDEPSLKSHIAYSAGQTKTASTTTGTGAVIELLKRAGHLKEEEGKLVVNIQHSRENASRTPFHEPETPTVVMRDVINLPSPRSVGQVSISIKVNVACSVSELDELGERLRKLLVELDAENASEVGEG